MLPDPIILHGNASEMTGEDVTLRYDGLDEVTQRWITTDPNLFDPGDAMPGYANVKIDQIARSRDAGDYILTLTGVGLVESKGTRAEKGFPKITNNLEALDEAIHSVISTSTNAIEIGDALSGYSNMYCVSTTWEQIHTGFYRINARYVGLIGTKPYKRTISVNGQTMDFENVSVIGLPGGWVTPAKGQISLPKVVVSDFTVINGDPPTNAIPGPLTPPDPPAVKSLSWSGPVRKVWPNGWTLSSIDGSYIAGTSIWAGTLTYEYVWADLPADS